MSVYIAQWEVANNIDEQKLTKKLLTNSLINVLVRSITLV